MQKCDSEPPKWFSVLSDLLWPWLLTILKQNLSTDPTLQFGLTTVICILELRVIMSMKIATNTHIHARTHAKTNEATWEHIWQTPQREQGNFIYLTVNDSQMRLSADFLQCISQSFVLYVSEFNSRKHIVQQCIKSLRVCIRQLRQRVDPQRLHNKLCFKTVIHFPYYKKFIVIFKLTNLPAVNWITFA